MDQLRLVLLILGVALIAGIFVWELYKKKVAERRRAQLFEHLEAGERGPIAGESLLGDIGQADPFDVVERIQGRRSADREPGPGEAEEELVGLDGYDIDEDFPGDAPEDVTETPLVREREPAVEVAPSGSSDDVARLSGFAARRDSPEQLDLAGLELAAPTRATDEVEAPQASGAARALDEGHPPAGAPSPDELHIVMTVMARSGERFSGDALRHALESADLYHGDMNIFHRHEQPKDLSTPTLFSAVNVLSPGYFEPERMDELASPGIAMFMRLPGPEHPSEAFQKMLEAARTVAQDLDGTLCDESRSTLTPQSINHLRERIADFGRRQMLKA
jgi:cell division protein ZipA